MGKLRYKITMLIVTLQPSDRGIGKTWASSYTTSWLVDKGTVKTFVSLLAHPLCERAIHHQPPRSNSPENDVTSLAEGTDGIGWSFQVS